MTPSSRPVAAIGKIGANGRQGLGDHSPFAVFQFGALPGDEPGRSCGGSGRCAPLSGSRRSGGPRPWAIFLDQGLSRPIPRRRRSRPQRPLALRNAGTPRKQNSGSLSALFAPVLWCPTPPTCAPSINPDHLTGKTSGFIPRYGPVPTNASRRACPFRSTSFRPPCGRDGRSIARRAWFSRTLRFALN
jgi:hypothetical protein